MLIVEEASEVLAFSSLCIRMGQVRVGSNKQVLLGYTLDEQSFPFISTRQAVKAKKTHM